MNNILSKKSGFSLVEVLISMMILTVSIVTATSVLIGLLDVNSDVLKRQKAYYLAVEGIEIMRNYRDSNFINNRDFMRDLVYGESYVWDGNSFRIFDGNNASLCRYNENARNFVSSCDYLTIGEDIKYDRVFKVKKYDSFEEGEAFLLESYVTWKDGTKEEEFFLETVFTNWME